MTFINATVSWATQNSPILVYVVPVWKTLIISAWGCWACDVVFWYNNAPARQNYIYLAWTWTNNSWFKWAVYTEWQEVWAMSTSPLTPCTIGISWELI